MQWLTVLYQDETDDPDAEHGVRSAWKVVDRVVAEREVDGAEGNKQHGSEKSKQRKDADATGQQAEKKPQEATGSGKLRRREFLVKWRELQYDACTWESEGDLAAWGAEAELARFRALEPIQTSAEARKVGSRLRCPDDAEQTRCAAAPRQSMASQLSRVASRLWYRSLPAPAFDMTEAG